MAFYTGKGDDGTTKTFDMESGVRMSKASPIAAALGSCDEINSYLGLCKVKSEEMRYRLEMGEDTHYLSEIVHEMQQNLFTIQAELAGADKKIRKRKINKLEKVIETIEELMPPVNSFRIPGGSELSTHFDVARTLARRAERTIVAVHDSKEKKLSKHALGYINRLSSGLYALARYSNYLYGANEPAPNYE